MRKWVVILGASSGFGAQAARAYAKNGYGIFGAHMVVEINNDGPVTVMVESP